VIGGYVYVLLAPDIIACFDRETGERTATAEINIENMDLRFWNNVTAHRQYLYLELSGPKGEFFARLDVNSITHGEPDMPRNITPEVLWKNVETAPGNIFFFHAKPVVYGDTVYVNTYNYRAKLPVQLAGFDTDTGQMVFHVTFGGPEDQTGNIPYPEKGGGENPILIHDGILYFLGLSIAAWNIETGERLYRHVFTYDTPEQKIYTSATYQPLFYSGKIYFTSGDSYDPQDGFRNIHCMDAATGKLIWNTITEGSLSLITNPVISGGRLYIPQFHGLFVFDPENGKLTGVDRSFHGANRGRNIMYGDYMITARRTPAGGKLVAVNIGR
jgi:outer membrane protein assembly factor BamB